MSKFISYLLSLISYFLVLSSSALAQVPKSLPGYKITGPGFNPINAIDATSKLELTISRIVGAMTVVGVIYFAIQIILAGYAYISSQGDSKKAEETKKRLTDGIIGIFLVVVSLGFSALFAKLLGLSDNIFNLNKMFGDMKL
jgi:hypothetical protein